MKPSQFESITLLVPLLSISRCDRWQAYQRLQDLEISCQCGSEGFLSVEITSPLALVQIQSVVQQLTASRQNLVDWLESCWQTKQ